MRSLKAILPALVLTVSAFSADTPPAVAVLPCGQGGQDVPGCNPSPKELKQAKIAFERGMKLQKAQQADAAYEQLEKATQLAPKNVDYATMREMARQQLVYEHLQHGNSELQNGRQVEALAEFRSALQLDPQNDFAQQRLNDALGEWSPRVSSTPQVLEDAEQLRLVPNPGSHDFHFRGDSRTLLTQVAQAFGLTAEFDDSVMPKQLRFNLEQADFDAAMRVVTDATHTFWTPLGDKQIYFAADTAESRRQFEQMSLRTFYIPGVSDPKDLNDIVNLLRQVFEIRFVSPQQRTSTITVRAPQRIMDAATTLLEGLGDGRPQLMIDIKVFEVSHTLMRTIGMHLPNQFQLFNIPAGALAALGGQNIQDLINQLISGGGINQAGSTGVAALLAQLQSQQGSIFSQPLATFGGGLTLFGLSLDMASITAALNESSIKTLEHASLRAAQGNEANLKIGTRFPILNASFAPIFNTPQISQVIQNNSFQSAFPSFNYEDLGLTVKAKPTVNSDGNVSLQVEMQVRSLGTTNLNGVPIISNREYKGWITVMDGEPAVVAGMVNSSEQKSLAGIPGLSRVPGLNKITATNDKQESDDELLIVITPHVLNTAENHPSEIWLQK